MGDSICAGYFPVVENLLGEAANLWKPPINGGTTENTLTHLDEWLSGCNPDIVHVNCGLHDLAREFDSEDTRVSLAAYRKNVEEILVRLKESTGAHIIWALTTPVNQTRHHENKTFDRFENFVTAYNDAAMEVTSALKVPVNDLYTPVMEAGRDRLLGPDGVHFTDEGYTLLGELVTRALNEAMKS